MSDKEKLNLAREELLQAGVELDEAAKIISGRNLPQVSNLFAIAAESKRKVANTLLPELFAAHDEAENVPISTFIRGAT